MPLNGRYLTCVMTAYGRRISKQRWDAMADELSDMGNLRARSVSRLFTSKQASEATGDQLSEADVEQALPIAASRSR